MQEKLLSFVRSIKLPTLCILCNQFHKHKYPVCTLCIELISPLGPCCQYCAYPLPQKSYLICGACVLNKPHFDNSYVAFLYEEPLRGLIHRFKYQKSLFLAPFLCYLMRQAAPKELTKTSCLIPVPMHPERIKQRGFNQAAVLCKLLAKEFKLHYDLRVCKKIINTSPQASLDAKQRKKNLHKAFQNSALAYEHIILIDDLLTTGSTANELADTFKKAGVTRVDVWVCARAVHLSDRPLSL